MSDSAQNVEIEDVLSSIRRLVSGDDWLRQPPGGVVDSGPEPVAAPEKFVLTPVLRVIAPELVPVDQIEAPPMVADFAQAEDAVDDHAVDEPQTGSDDPGASYAIAADDAPLPYPPVENVIPIPEDTPFEFIVDPASIAEIEPRLHLEATIAELEAAVSGQSQDWEPDGSEQSVVSDKATAWVAPRRPVMTEIADAELATDHVGPEDEVTFHHVGADFVTDEILEDLATGLGGAGAAAYGAQMDENLSDYLDQDSVIDEQMLRDLVADIVRQELQGALGERITRNVRKLVRREIYRVLASQEFD